MAWTLTLGESSWTAQDLTGDVAVLACVGLGGDSWEITPVLGVVHLVAVLAAFVSVASGVPYLQAVAELRALPLSVLTDALSLDDD